MSGRGEIVPELATLLRDIARRIDRGEATHRDSAALQRLAAQAAGEDRNYAVKVHRTRGQRAKGAVGVNQRYRVAQMVREYRQQHGGNLDDAFEALDGTFMMGRESIRKAWQEMSPLAGASSHQRDLILFFKRLQAKQGGISIKRRKRER